MAKTKLNCIECGGETFKWPSQINDLVFCSKSCHRTYKNKKDNPSLHRDLSGKNNPMFGRHLTAWNRGIKGEDCHNWKGGIHIRKDGYVRINIEGKRKLLHRHLLKSKLKDGNVVHHLDHNPTNNNLNNLKIFPSQSEHVKFEHDTASNTK